MIDAGWVPQGWTIGDRSSAGLGRTRTALDWIRLESAGLGFQAEVSRTVDVLGVERIAVRAWDETREFRLEPSSLVAVGGFLQGLAPIPQGDLFAGAAG